MLEQIEAKTGCEIGNAGRCGALGLGIAMLIAVEADRRRLKAALGNL